MTRIGGYINDEEHATLKDYAASFFIKESELAGLLVVREFRLRRLENLAQHFTAGAHVSVRQRVTAPTFPPRVREAFERRVVEAGLSTDQALSILVRAELAERWLDRAIRMESD